MLSIVIKVSTGSMRAQKRTPIDLRSFLGETTANSSMQPIEITQKKKKRSYHYYSNRHYLSPQGAHTLVREKVQVHNYNNI